ncbi:type II toxin-antitoxin system VapC family toxin [Paraburkholderia phymatum]|uniref:type II toxin-antitoxin system VapC family toxin n=1 Tax=Paraburkholderia phymatum TaxID=148447 RepID=UPI00316DA4F7
MMYLLDTNVISELRNPAKTDPNVLAWAASQPVTDQYLSAITVLELELGVKRAERADPAKGQVLRKWLDRQVLPRFGDRILSFDARVAIQCAGLHVPDQRPLKDSMIAATAQIHGMKVVTRNIRDFEGIAVGLINPWEQWRGPEN